MLRVLALLAVTACADGSRGTATSAPGSGTGTGTGSAAPKRFEPSCSASFAPKPDRDGAPMCSVPAGEITITMPADPSRGAERAEWRVRVSKPFYIDQYELTNAQYVAFLRAGGHACGKAERYCFGGSSKRGYDLETLTVEPAFEKLPAEVTLAGAEAYCAWAGKRLPTDAEWELAARFDPATAATRTYPWGDTYTPGVANHFGTIVPRRGKLAPVGSFPEDRSAVGAYDMGGNATEWVVDCYVRVPSCSLCVDVIVRTHCEEICEQGDSEACFPARVVRGGSISTKTPAGSTRVKAFPHWPDGIRCAR